MWTLRYSSNLKAASRLGLLVLALGWTTIPAAAQPPPRPKTVRGVVRDLRGQGIADARVFVRNMEDNVIRTLPTDREGLYSIFGLPPTIDYEIHAEFRGESSETKIVSGFLDRQDNVLNFELNMTIIPAADALGQDEDDPVVETFDRVRIYGSFEMPENLPAPIPAALLLHGFGESRVVWEDLEERLLAEGWAVMAIDLRGHGLSTTRNMEAITPQQEWRTDSRGFPQDIEPALNWLQSHARLDSNRIAVIGADVGANLALIAGGRFPEVGTVVAINPNLAEALELAGTARAFTPRMAQLIVPDEEVGSSIRAYVTGASRITVVRPEFEGTGAWLAAGETIDEILRWLKDTYF